MHHLIPMPGAVSIAIAIVDARHDVWVDKEAAASRDGVAILILPYQTLGDLKEAHDLIGAQKRSDYEIAILRPSLEVRPHVS